MRAAEALRREGYDGPLTLVGAEPHWPPFDRPPLSKQVLSGTWTEAKARLRTELDPATDPNLELLLGRTASALDLTGRRVTLDDGSSLEFGGLVIATGTTPRLLAGVEPRPGLHVLRTRDDCVSLRDDLASATRVVIIGAGFIGCEVAASCRALGLEVTLVEALPLPLARVLGEGVGRMTLGLHKEHGVDVRVGTGVASVNGERRVESVTLATGDTIAAEVVVVGIGVVPNTAWLEGSGLTLDNGVVCEPSLLAAGAERIVAAGDVARWPNLLYGPQLARIEHWTNAAEQAEHAATTLLRVASGEEPAPFTSVPYFWSEQYDVRFQMVGAWAEDDHVHVAEGDPLGAERKGVLAFVRDGTVVGALCIRRPNRTLVWRRHIEARARWPVAVDGG